MTNTTTKSTIKTLRELRHWFETQRKVISKGSGSSWDMGQCDEQMEIIDEALRLTDGAQDAPGGAVADNRRCPKCNATRGGESCWKCGTETFTPDPRCGDDPRLPPIDRIRELAKEVGYAVGVHGSQQRDLDVIAAPWSDNAVGNHALIEHIAKGLATENGPARVVDVERKPLGRYAATIQMDGWYKQLDISVCPNEQYSVAVPAADKAGSGEVVSVMREALKFYADGEHFHMHQPGEWDTVSGEPPNFYEDSENTATVEDGSVAKMALAEALALAASQDGRNALDEAMQCTSTKERT